MALQVPKLEEKTYSDLVNEALARIRVHNPQWTNYNESDPGVTLLELFAFMTESLIYRANLIPERNRRKFLTLLGVPMQAAAAARGIVTFANDRGPLEAVTLPADLELKAGQVPFRAEEGLEVLPVEARVYYKRPLADDEKAEAEQIYARLYGPLGSTGELLYYETRELEPPVDPSQISSIDLATGTVDGSLWIALLARPSDKNLDEVRAKLSGRVLNIGVLPALTGESRTLLPGRTTGARRHAALIFEAATDQFQGETPLYERLQARTTADILVEPGVAAVTLPASIGLWAIAEPLTAGTGAYPPTLEDTKEEERLLTWIRVRRPDQESGSGLTAKLSWIGINAVTVTQRARVEAELLGKGTGEPDQSFTLINTPVIPGTVKLTVGGEMWQETDDLLAAGPEVPVKDRRLAPGQMQPRVQPSRVFTVDRESGVIRFGTGLAGARPPAGAVIRASYDYGGGRQGNVNGGALNKGAALPAGFKVTNPIPTWGGDEPETVAEAERNIPQYLRHRDRTVSQQDFADIVRRTPGVDIGRVEVLPLFNPALPELLSPGVVTVMVVPRYDVARPEAPLPDRLFLDLVCDWVDPRRLVTTEIYVRGPVYVPIYVSVGIEVVPGRDFPNVREAVNRALKLYLSPLAGGREGQGWPLDKAVLAKELWAEAARVDGVAYVRDLYLGDANGVQTEQVAMAGLQLPWLYKVDTREGDPEPLDQLLGRSGAGDGTGGTKTVVPVPVIPQNCR